MLVNDINDLSDGIHRYEKLMRTIFDTDHDRKIQSLIFLLFLPMYCIVMIVVRTVLNVVEK